jgi:hypothetical protein
MWMRRMLTTTTTTTTTTVAMGTVTTSPEWVTAGPLVDSVPRKKKKKRMVE